MPRASTSTGTTSRFARPRGAWITKTQAYSDYSLGPTDLDAIQPTSIERIANGRGFIHKYNECDVQLLRAKVVEMMATLQVGAPAGDTVPQRGGTIVRTKAKQQYNLHDNQIDRIRPCRIQTNPRRQGSEMRIYNVCDVQALADGIASLWDRPAPEDARIMRDAVPYGGPGDPDRNIFDVQSSDDAAALFARLTNPRPRPSGRVRTRATRANPY
ncbi:hypothetical protein PENSPDRAFT_731760 [Peniophora sp. CONT]|nr:hypothetical protein PENSPDRAFT_731760 [Peniophora sp. CONT]